MTYEKNSRNERLERKVREMNLSPELSVLVVDDRPENLAAAREYFDSVKGIKVDYRTTANSALEAIDANFYDFVITDRELPRIDGGQTERLGETIAYESELRWTRWAIVTSGIDHHNCRSAFVRYHENAVMEDYADWNAEDIQPIIGVIEKDMVRAIYQETQVKWRTGELKGYGEITETPKTSPQAWEEVFRILLCSSMCRFPNGDEENYLTRFRASKLRAYQTHKKPFRTSRPINTPLIEEITGGKIK